MKQKISRWILIVSVALNVIFAIWGIRRYCRMQQQLKDQSRFTWADLANNQKMAVFANLEIGHDDIAFVGTSLTENFPLEELMPGLHIKNRGISGNTTAHLLGRIEEVVKYRPKKVFIEGGINDLIASANPDSVFLRYTAVLDIIQQDRIPAYVQSLLPTCKSYAGLNNVISTFNERLKTYCNTHGFVYIDIHTDLMDGNKLNEAYTYDGLHLNVKGYQIWKTKIYPYLR